MSSVLALLVGKRADPSRVVASIAALVVVLSGPARAQSSGAVASEPSAHVHGSLAAADELFPAREVSGTAWLPDETAHDAVHRHWGDWNVMLHGNVFAQFLYEPADRHRTGGFSTHQVSSVNWGMIVARRRIGRARVGLRTMISLEPWTVPGCGYLSFLATGEMCEGDTTHDRQHPHDLMGELAADYDGPLRGSLRYQIYAGLSGEPALGPAGFPHRTSTLLNPIAPISHHWLDATHTTYGLVTTGVYGGGWKAEMSLFNGREPDDRRVGLELAPLDSVSGRLTLVRPGVAFQVSAAHLNEAKAEFPPQPRTSVNRATASVTYHRVLADAGLWATTLAYGVNAGREIIPGGMFDAVTHATVLETSATLRGRQTWFGRAEIVGMPAHDLHAHEYATSIFTVGKLQSGYVRHFTPRYGMVPGIGGTLSVSLLPPELVSRYGGRAVFGFGVFVNVHPAAHAHGD